MVILYTRVPVLSSNVSQDTSYPDACFVIYIQN
jgi:hypothetical protein